jgi:quercetin dioxygenase-like cupin family protein
VAAILRPVGIVQRFVLARIPETVPNASALKAPTLVTHRTARLPVRRSFAESADGVTTSLSESSREVGMVRVGLRRRAFVEALVGFPLGGLALSAQTSSPPVSKVAAGSGRANDIITLPGGDRIHVKVGSQDSGGALFMTEQPIERRGTGPPKHYREEQDEWFYGLAGEYVFEIGDQRFRLGPGDSVLGPRRVPHAFVYDGAGPGRILIGFTPAGRIEQFFRDLEKRGKYFGSGSPEDKELAHRLYGIVNVGPPLKL